MVKKSIIIALMLQLFVSLPIWYYLLFKILTLVNATELMWFLYIVYIPVGIFNAIIAKIGGENGKKSKV